MLFWNYSDLADLLKGSREPLRVPRGTSRVAGFSCTQCRASHWRAFQSRGSPHPDGSEVFRATQNPPGSSGLRTFLKLNKYLTTSRAFYILITKFPNPPQQPPKYHSVLFSPHWHWIYYINNPNRPLSCYMVSPISVSCALTLHKSWKPAYNRNVHITFLQMTVILMCNQLWSVAQVPLHFHH